MRVLITADPYIPVPPLHYGGIERVIDVLVRELVRRGHDVTLVAHPDSRTPARLVPYGEPPHVGYRIRAKELVQVGSALWRERRDVDVVHSFGRLAALLPILPRRQLPKIQSYQRDGVPWTQRGPCGPAGRVVADVHRVFLERLPASIARSATRRRLADDFQLRRPRHVHAARGGAGATRRSCFSDASIPSKARTTRLRSLAAPAAVS